MELNADIAYECLKFKKGQSEQRHRRSVGLELLKQKAHLVLKFTDFYK